MQPEKLYKIGEVMNFTGLSRQTIHNYTMAGLIVEAKRTPTGHRLYDDRVFQYLERIKHMQKDRTLLEIKKIFEEERRLEQQSEGKQLSIDFDAGTQH